MFFVATAVIVAKTLFVWRLGGIIKLSAPTKLYPR